MEFSNGLFPTQRPRIVSGDGFVWLEAAGYVKTVSPGCIALLPLGVIMLQRIASMVRFACQKHGFWEVALPLLQKHELWQESGRAEQYPDLLCETIVGDTRYVINPTQEEAILDLFRSAGFLESDLPLRFFHIGERTRNEIRPVHGLIRSRCFTLTDIYALTRTEAECEKEAQKIEAVMNDVLKWAGLPIQKGVYYPSAISAQTYSYWIPSATKQCTVPVCCNCGASYRVRERLTTCPSCSSTEFELIEAVEIGDVMRSGSTLSRVMKAKTTNGEHSVSVVMAGIGVSRLLQLLAEHYHDKNGLTWPMRIAPFQVHVITTSSRNDEANNLYANLRSNGYEVLLDRRPQSFGRLLVDADLIGIPVRIVFGSKTPIGKFEVKCRRTGETSDMSTYDDVQSLLHKIDSLQQKENL